MTSRFSSSLMAIVYIINLPKPLAQGPQVIVREQPSCHRARWVRAPGARVATGRSPQWFSTLGKHLPRVRVFAKPATHATAAFDGTSESKRVGLENLAPPDLCFPETARDLLPQ